MRLFSERVGPDLRDRHTILLIHAHLREHTELRKEDQRGLHLLIRLGGQDEIVLLGCRIQLDV
jgi:hypothetical protein